LLAFAADQGAGTGATGERCGLSQSGPVWYHAANFGGGKATRSYRAPRGKSILVPLLTAQAAPKLLFASVSCRFVKMHVDGTCGMRGFIDGVEIPDLVTYRETSAGCFQYTDPAGNRVPRLPRTDIDCS
jgi:hypothetical protein